MTAAENEIESVWRAKYQVTESKRSLSSAIGIFTVFQLKYNAFYVRLRVKASACGPTENILQ